jgi:anti-sigma regulatory factor (Ser/Thr protein kinase)
VEKIVSAASVFLPIDDVSRIAEARRIAVSVAEREGLPPGAQSNVAIVASEIGSNLVKHAKRGEMHISALSSRGEPGVEILSIDRGPGMSNLAMSLGDGHSTTGTSGTGLGAVQRLSDVFDITSQRGKGTVLVSQIAARKISPPQPGFRIGLASRPVAGEVVSGDAWAVRLAEDHAILMVSDGLGHGILAEDASHAAVGAFEKSSETSAVGLLQVIHRALHGTRGAAVAVARIEFREACVKFAGLGNIAGSVVGRTKTQSMVSHNGTAGFQATHFREFVYPWEADNVIVMHSDGLSSSWNAASFPGLSSHHPTVIGGLLYRESARDRDDACILVGKRL